MPDLNAIYAKMLEWAAEGRRSVRIEISTQHNYSPTENTAPTFFIHCYDFDMEVGCTFKDWAEFNPETIGDAIRERLNFDMARTQRKLTAMKEAEAAKNLTAAPVVAQ